MAFNKTVFPICTIDRQDIKWEDYLYELTPVEFHADSKTGKGCYFKREDYFAPLGYGGLNGSKLRQAIYLGSQNLVNSRVKYLVGAMSLHSPQLCFTGDTLFKLSSGETLSFEDSLKRETLKVKTLNSEGKVTAQEIEKPFETGEVQDLVELEFEDSTVVRCTPEHKFLTKKGYKAAKDLSEEDELVTDSD